MDDAFFDVQAAQKDRDTSIPEFHMHPVYVGKNKQTGIEQYEDRPYVKILNPGQKDIWDGPVTDEHKARWPTSWAAFEAGQEAPLNGFPIENWGVIGPSDVRMLKSCNCPTVEHLASMPDGNLGRVGPGAVELKKKAIRWLREHESQASLLDRIERLERGEGTQSIPPPKTDESEQVKALRVEIRALKKQIREMKATDEAA